MPAKKAFKCVVDVTFKKIVGISKWHSSIEQFYISIELFDVLQRTRPQHAVFPLRINENYVFEKYFLTPCDPREVVRLLQDMPVKIELRSVLGNQREGPLLAYYETNARDFLYPFRSMAIQTRDREIELIKTEEFHGQGLIVEFSTYTVLQETKLPVSTKVTDSFFGDLSQIKQRKPLYDSYATQPMCLCHQVHHAHHSGSCCCCIHSYHSMEPIGSSQSHVRSSRMHKSRSKKYVRSPSPQPVSLEYRQADESQKDEKMDTWSVPYDRPPFVVRKADYKLLGRIPVLDNNYHDTAHRSVYSKRFKARSISPTIRYKATWCDQHLLPGPGRKGCEACKLLYQQWKATSEASHHEPRHSSSSDSSSDGNKEERKVKNKTSYKNHKEKNDNERMEKNKKTVKRYSSQESSSDSSSASSYSSDSNSQSDEDKSEENDYHGLSSARHHKGKHYRGHRKHHIPYSSSARCRNLYYYPECY